MRAGTLLLAWAVGALAIYAVPGEHPVWVYLLVAVAFFFLALFALYIRRKDGP